MPVETTADRLEFFDADEFGVAVSYTVDGGSPVTINGMFDNAMSFNQLGEAGIVAAAPSLTVRTSDLPSGSGEGDAVTINGIPYQVAADPLDDGTGITELTLERND